MGTSSPPQARRTRHAPTTTTAPFHFSSAAGDPVVLDPVFSPTGG
jgi:hypothetical protein